MKHRDTTEVTELLRSLPDMQPPEDGWTRIRESQRRVHPYAWSGAALAAGVALFALFFVTRNDLPVEPLEMLVVTAERVPEIPASTASAALERADVSELRRRSQQMERMLRGLPPRTQVVRADVAGAIAELQDRIAAVDYELNRVTRGRSSQPAVTRWPAGSAASTSRSRARPVPRELWRQRVDLMDRLVRARYVEAGAEAY